MIHLNSSDEKSKPLYIFQSSFIFHFHLHLFKKVIFKLNIKGRRYGDLN